MCMLWTNVCADSFLKRIFELNVELIFIETLIPIYRERCRNGFDTLASMEGGFHISSRVILIKRK